MAGAGDGEEFGEALQQAENDRFEHSKVNVAFSRKSEVGSRKFFAIFRLFFRYSLPAVCRLQSTSFFYNFFHVQAFSPLFS